jgi:hypothetical protein
MREDVGEVTTSLHRPASDNSRSGMSYDSFEWQQDPHPTNGVPRSAWSRQHRRVSRWHRPYTLALLFLDLASTLLASRIGDSLLGKARSGFQGRELLGLHDEQLFGFFAYVVLPLGWLLYSGANGSYDRRLPGPGQRGVQAGRAQPRSPWSAGVSLLAFATSHQPVPRPRSRWSRSAGCCSSSSSATWPGRCCTSPGAAPGTARTGWCWSARCPRRSRSTPRSPAARRPA